MALGNEWGDNAYAINMAILKIDRSNCAACTRLAKYFKLQNNTEEAKKMYMRAVSIDPGNRGALNNLNDMEQERKENEIIDKFTTPKELLKEGQYYMLKGRYDMAVRFFSRAFGMEPLLVYAVSIACAYKKMGKYDMVEKLYNELLEGKSVNADAETVKKEFARLNLNEGSE
jgi:tetratricopeptide (TPR) repeat protein